MQHANRDFGFRRRQPVEIAQVCVRQPDLALAWAGFLAGVLSARLWSQETPESVAFVRRLLRGDGKVLREDKGA
ncbi:hypothetical protein [Methylosinus sp. Sm6]|uniref:hypothetical protein n=1 Tax=Methylosinus sp. Sm6 TaxID=2866948 RepID=UPI001C98EF85|nr:hypothetical protein [Methylosinus sp. Sm6]MBY6240266.1 hypothetical protein [Methylosinus sp. Sm6]